MGIPAPLLHALTSPTRHRGRSTLPGNPPPPRAPTEGMLRPAGAARRARSNSLPSLTSREKQPKQRLCVSAGRWDRTRVLHLRPTRLARPGTTFQGGPPTARPGPRNPSGRGITCGLGISCLPLSCLRFPDGWQEEVAGSRHPPCRGLQAKRENFLLNRGTQGPREPLQCPRGWQSPAAPLAAALAQSGEHVHG